MRVGGLGALEGVRADELSEPVGLMCCRADGRPHLVHDDVVPAFGELPGGLAAGEAATDDVEGRHGRKILTTARSGPAHTGPIPYGAVPPSPPDGTPRTAPGHPRRRLH